MKLTAFILLISFLQISAKGLAQKITLVERDKPIGEVLHKIEQQSGYKFWYHSGDLDDTHSINIEARNLPLSQVLDMCFNGQGLSWKIIKETIVLNRVITPAPAAVPLADTLRGRIVDNTGNPVPGATILVKGSKVAAISNADGYYRLPGISGEVTIIVSNIGFQRQEIATGGRSHLDIKIVPEVSMLENVVVVGYGTQKKVNLTGAVTQVSGEVLDNRPITRISQGLQGMVAGLNIVTNTGGGAPNATQNINIRGYTGLGTTGGPLVVIDGIQGGDINAINPNDVESISVLKDAASTAIYGSSAPYGVILITTKKGKLGQPTKIAYNNNLSWAQAINLPKMLNSLDFANLYNEAFVNAGKAPDFNDETIARIKAYQDGTLATQTIKNPNTPNGWNSWASSNANNDWFKIYFKDFAFSQQHNISVSGASEKSNYYISVGYNDRSGMYNFGKDDFKRFNIRANLTSNVTNWLTFNFRSTMSRSLYNTPNVYSGQTGGNYMHQIARKYPTVALINPDGHYSDESNVLLHLQGGRDKSTEDQPMLTGEFQIKPLKGWDITMNYTFDGDIYDRQNQLKTVYVFLPDGTTAPSSGTSPNSFTRNNYRNEHHIVNAFTSYEKDFNRHHFRIMGGFTSELTSYASYSASNTQLYSNDIPALNLTYNPTPSVGDQVRRLAVEGYFGRFNYNFAGKYLLEINGRYDGTSRFLAGRRWKLSPGVSAGWNLDRENFWKSISPVINAFKLRASYGSSPDQMFLGDPSIGSYYPFYPLLGTTSPNNTSWLFGGNKQASVSQPPLVNPDLTWVTTTSYGIGTDMSLLNNRLTVSYDYYIRKANDFAGPAAVVPVLLGTGLPSVNNAAIQTKGFEVTAQWSDRIGKLHYSARASLSDYRGKVVAYNNPPRSLSTWYVGQQMGEIWGYTTNGLYQSDADAAKAPVASFWKNGWRAGDVSYADLNGDGQINNGKNTVDSSGDLRVIGNNTPRYQYSLNLNFDYKGFDLGIFLQGIAKRDAWVGSNYFWGITGDEWQSSPFTVQANNRYTASTPNGYFPKYYMSSENGKNTQVQSRYLQNAAYLRIKSVQLGYTLPASMLSPIRMQKVRVYFNVENLATFTKLIKTIDPELSISDAKIYPLQRTFSCGINVIL
ncbi:TonB-dependent receptor [Chitinophaga eiseniae]|uniref:TonB-dependent receptor n=1 Tax=Chitinophaga eiseniae TaxID=634771 RepID=A0A847SMZ7_9BACT|nr:TonB-dependent receptor [Chitinophaga eiseniae]NLR80237.1 TonB-dependent receptor [Chitinophaga eiseniae]